MLVLRPLISYLLVIAAVAEATNLRQGQRNLQTYTSSSEYLSAMLARVNQERAAHGLPALCTNKKLQNAAQGHSDDQAANNYMDHTGTDGTSVSERITRSGYDWSAVAENVAAGQPDVDSVMENWMNSPGHRENILGDYTMFGCAYAHNTDTTYQHYWTQDFGTGDAEECDGGNVASEVQGTAVEDTPVETDTTSVDEPVTIKSLTTEDSYSHVQETDAPCTDAPVEETYATHTDPPVVVVDPLPYGSHGAETPIVDVEETEAPCTDAPVVVVDPLPYGSHGAETPIVDVEETEAPCTDAPVVVVDPLPYGSETPVVETEAPCTDAPVVVVDPLPYGSHEDETPIAIVDPPEAFADGHETDAPVVEQPEETPVVVVDPLEVTPAPAVYKNYATPNAHIPATDKRPYGKDCDTGF
ncbi:hypothetical protein JG688_00015513 [Phytophthora aleatoria]|uniref:SCP domain-containing protein n=1 Tax=Phytophthora aleatoria TaxID=2496075 RepID=A0A8J5IE14_9STRA|nr:hypothetical protein JG688_00015513 [Phytophthora aleatoria]